MCHRSEVSQVHRKLARAAEHSFLSSELSKKRLDQAEKANKRLEKDLHAEKRQIRRREVEMSKSSSKVVRAIAKKIKGSASSSSTSNRTSAFRSVMRHMQHTIAKKLKNLDAKKDSESSKQQVSGSNDLEISPSGLRIYHPAPTPKPSLIRKFIKRNMAFFKNLDANKDGVISKKEFINHTDSSSSSSAASASSTSAHTPGKTVKKAQVSLVLAGNPADYTPRRLNAIGEDLAG